MTAAPARWIVDARTDVLWFLAPVVTGWVCLYVNVALGVSSFLIWWFWNVAANGPHFWATISRTYVDREEWRERKLLLLLSLGWLLLGPLAIVASIRLQSLAPFVVFWVFQVVWAYFHVVRQHYGFMVLYQRLNGEPAGADNPADFWIFHVLMLGPVGAWFLRYPEFRQLVGWSATPSGAERFVLDATPVVLAGAAAWYVAKELLGWRRTGRLNVPKSALLAAYVPLHLVLLLNPMLAGVYDVLLFQAIVTFPHNLQYVAIVWVHNRNRYGAAEARARYGWAAAANGTVWRFALLGVAFSVVLFYARFYLEGQSVPFGVGHFAWADVRIGGMFRVADVVAATWIGIVFNHQYLDQKIWKLSRDRRLTRDLRLDRAPEVVAHPGIAAA